MFSINRKDSFMRLLLIVNIWINLKKLEIILLKMKILKDLALTALSLHLTDIEVSI